MESQGAEDAKRTRAVIKQPESQKELVEKAGVETLRTALKDAARWINKDGQTLLFFAVVREAECKEVCELLIDVHKVDPTKTDRRGQTALHYLAKSKHVSCVDLLVSRGCKIDHVDGFLRQTPLFYAARYSTRAMVKRLVDLNADVAAKDVNNQSPLFWAEALDVCEELLHRGCGDAFAPDKVGTTVVEHHARHHRHDLADFLSACAEVRSQRGRMTWAVQAVSQGRANASSGSRGAPAGGSASTVIDLSRSSPLPGGAIPRAAVEYGNYASYATSLARSKDVDELCRLEDEFVEDHRRMLKTDPPLPEAELWSQIGLNQDAATRRNTIRSIAQPTQRSGKVRHYTLKCLYMPPNPQRQSGGARSKTYTVVGYVYFRICDGDRKEDASGRRAGASPASAAPATPAANSEKVEGLASSSPSGLPLPASQAPRHTRGHIVVSHLKVSRKHQRRGVATLLLAGMLQLAETERRNFVCCSLHLSVVARNESAAALYEQLGFVKTFKDGETVEWLHMKLQLATGADGNPTTASLRERWLRRVSGICGSISHDAPGQPAPKRRTLQEELQDQILPDDLSRPSKRRMEIKTPSSPSQRSAVSNITTSTSVGASSSGTSSEISSRSFAKLTY